MKNKKSTKIKRGGLDIWLQRIKKVSVFLFSALIIFLVSVFLLVFSFFHHSSHDMHESFREFPMGREGRVVSKKETIIGNLSLGRDMVRSAFLSLVVNDVESSAREIEGLVNRSGGYLQSAEIRNVDEKTKEGSLVVKIPVNQFLFVREQIKKGAVRVESEKESSFDVTGQLVDLKARLNNKIESEKAYARLLKSAESTEDILMISDRLERVRTEIESLKGRIKQESERVDMVVLNIELVPEKDVQVFGFDWQPWLTIKRGFRSLFQGVTFYFDWLITIIISLPVIGLWILTFVGFVVLVVKAFKATIKYWQ